MRELLDHLSRGTYLTRERLRLIPGALLLGYAVALVVLAATAHGPSDYRGRPLGTDFSGFYAAGHAALHGAAAAPFDPARQYALEQALFGHATPFYAWLYPPLFLLVAAPLAALPYLGALALWEGATIAFYLAALGMLAGAGFKSRNVPAGQWVLLALAFPAAFVNLIHANNGFLTAALMAAGLAQLPRRPLVAGILFGLLAYKPQFAMMIPLALAFGGYWRALVSGALTVAALAALATLVFGPQVWSAFLASAHFARTVVLEDGNTGFHKMQSVFAWTRLWGGSIALAYLAQGVASGLAAVTVAAAWRGAGSFADKGALLCIAAFIATPYCLDYDLVVLAPAIALLAAQGLARGFRPYEATLLAALWLMPILARETAAALLLPLGPIMLVTAGATLAWWRVRPALPEPVTDRPALPPGISL